MIRALSVTGFHKSGKTRVVVSIVRELTKRGYRVGTVKHIPEKDFTIDKPGKDTWVHAKSGAKIVVSLAPREVAKIERHTARIEEVLQGLQGLDFVVVEGFKAFSGPAKIIVAKTEAEAKKLFDKFTIACVGAGCLSVPTFGFEQSKKLTDLVEQKAYPLTFNLDCGHCGFDRCEDFAAAVVAGKRKWNGCTTLANKVSLIVDGKTIPLNPFTQKILAGAIKGMISSLKGAKGDKIEMVVRSAG